MVRRAVVAVVVAALAFVATGCKRDITKEVLFVNDSVTHQSIVSIVTELNMIEKSSPAGRYAPNFGSSVAGIGLRQVGTLPPGEIDAYWTNHITSLVEHVDPEVIVIELGYNDCD